MSIKRKARWICRHAKFATNTLTGLREVYRRIVHVWPPSQAVVTDSYGRQYQVQPDGSLRRYAGLQVVAEHAEAA